MIIFKMANCISYLARNHIAQNILRTIVLKHTNPPLKCVRKYSSALFISGKHPDSGFAFLKSYLDLDDKVADMEKLQRDLSARGLKINAEEVREMWEFYKSISLDKAKLEAKLAQVSNQITDISETKELSRMQKQQYINKLREQAKVIKDNMKAIRAAEWDVSESIVEKLLKLPNDVDQRTPLQSAAILKRSSTLKQSSGPTTDHIEIGRKLGLLEYKNPMQYYLCNEASLFELGVLNYVGSTLSGDNMIKITGSDFSRSFLVEGSGLNHEDPFDSFVINNHQDVGKSTVNRMHLVGSASLVSFLAMHSKQLINPNHFPIKYFCTGRQYTPFRPNSTPIGLFTVCQSSAAHAFVLVRDANSSEYYEQFEKLVNTVSVVYDNICNHYQIITRPATELRPWEAMRVSFELWSAFSKQYIEVGHISVCGNYFSKRLLIAYQTATGRDFPSIISGTVLSVPRLLGCLLEQNPNKFVIPPKITEHLPVFS